MVVPEFRICPRKSIPQLPPYWAENYRFFATSPPAIPYQAVSKPLLKLACVAAHRRVRWKSWDGCWRSWITQWPPRQPSHRHRYRHRYWNRPQPRCRCWTHLQSARRRPRLQSRLKRCTTTQNGRRPVTKTTTMKGYRERKCAENYNKWLSNFFLKQQSAFW